MIGWHSYAVDQYQDGCELVLVFDDRVIHREYFHGPQGYVDALRLGSRWVRAAAPLDPSETRDPEAAERPGPSNPVRPFVRTT